MHNWRTKQIFRFKRENLRLQGRTRPNVCIRAQTLTAPRMVGAPILFLSKPRKPWHNRHFATSLSTPRNHFILCAKTSFPPTHQPSHMPLWNWSKDMVLAPKLNSPETMIYNVKWFKPKVKHCLTFVFENTLKIKLN